MNNDSFLVQPVMPTTEKPIRSTAGKLIEYLYKLLNQVIYEVV